MDKSSREYEVCLCRHVKRGQIEDFIKETGTTELKAVCTAMNIGNVCGAGSLTAKVSKNRCKP